MRIALVSDAWMPQVNGVVRTLRTTAATLAARGHEVRTVTPDLFRTIPCPSYPEIRLAIGCGAGVAARLEAAAADAIHIATEGPLGWAARRWCLSRKRPFSTSFHTRFPDYCALRTGLPPGLFWPVVRHFHRPAGAVMAATDRLADELRANGLRQTHLWSRGVDLGVFAPEGRHAPWAALPRPIQLYVGRLAVEKNIDAFLATDVPGTRVVVGDGPARALLERRYPGARFMGALAGDALAAAYRTADVLVFPSRTDTFGLVMIEALASGTPVAAFTVPGPLDVLGPDARGRNGTAVGALNDDLGVAIRRALTADRRACASEGMLYSWDTCTDQFSNGLQTVTKVIALAA